MVLAAVAGGEDVSDESINSAMATAGIECFRACIIVSGITAHPASRLEQIRGGKPPADAGGPEFLRRF